MSQPILLMDFSETRKRLKKLNIKPCKKLGQNFLINLSLSHQIVSSIADLNPQKIIEIGPGLGSLTELLAELNIPLQLVELDPVLCSFWKKRQFNVIQKDALKLNEKQCFNQPCTVVGNLPYHISNTFIVSASIQWKNIENMVIMMQKETAERILSPHKKKIFGWLSVLSQCVWDCQKLTDVKISDFYPEPQVEGCVLILKKKKELNEDLESFLQFLKVCFTQKRKFLKKKLKQALGPSIAPVLHKMNWPDSIRAEELTPAQYCHFFKIYSVENLTKKK